ncbi:MAG TPA: alkaline phosphatase family protein [Acidimicrobiales bacterium]|nr:alkaline phosphatase family protein [Acidimicrobiales bacterium]
MPASVDAFLDILLSPDLVEMVVRSTGPDAYEALAVDGSVAFNRVDGALTVDAVTGRNPLADQAVDRFVGADLEQSHRYPDRTANSYPHAYEVVAQVFDHPCAPDLCVIHTAGHNWEDQGGHRGEHGSLDVVQARAPFIIAGRGVQRLGFVDRACRLIDVAPTIAELLGAGPMLGADGVPRLDVLDDGTRPDHVVGFLFDGANPNVLYAMAEAGDAPNVARLIEMGTAFRYGAMSSLPTVTLANHTAILTGAHPGHHGILHNAWYDRARREQVITNSPATWAGARDWLWPTVNTLHEAVLGSRDDAFSASVNEPTDRGASWSTFDEIRSGSYQRPDLPPELPNATERFVRPVKEYRWSSKVDHIGMEHAVRLVSGDAMPTFLWVNFTLTDAAFHEGGPHSEIAAASVRDTDARLGRILDAVDAAGRMDRTAFVLVADHGMEETNPACTGDWGVALRDAGLRFRDEAYGFLYLDG